MSLEKLEDEDTDEQIDEEAGEEAKPRLNLKIDVGSPSTCERHITVTIAREDIDRYYSDAFSKMMDTAVIPGFRAGRAPRKLVETRFRKEVGDQIKGSLLVDAMSQVNEDQKLAAISEPDIDVDSVKVPDEGPMTFEFNLEVRPDFEVPNWKGLALERQVKEFNAEDVDRQLRSVLERHSRLVPHSGPAGSGDFVTVNLTSSHDGHELLRRDEETLCLRPTLSFRDGKVEKFDTLLSGAKAGDRRTTKLKVGEDAANEALRGQEVDLEFEVLEVKKFELPELNAEFLAKLGDFQSEDELRDAIEMSLKRQLEYRQQQQARLQITKLLTESADWELPPDLLKRQSERELQRSVLELRRSGFSDADIRAHENQLRQNSASETARALREHFILERIAEVEKIDAEPEDYDHEVKLIAAQSNESPRRVRAQLEKRGMMDSLHNQIIERKVIEEVLKHAKFKDVDFQLQGGNVEALDLSASGGDKAEIPEAEHGEAASKLPEHKDRS